MKFRLIAVGQKMPDWVTDGFKDYADRLPADFRLELVELPLAQRSKSQSIERAINNEGERILATLHDRERVIALDVRGKSWSTEKLAEQLRGWREDARDVAFIIGGPDGLSDQVMQRAEQKWSLSALTLPHPLVRVVVAEQLYRAWSILNNHPYHRA